jgi:hypothetical protein
MNHAAGAVTSLNPDPVKVGDVAGESAQRRGLLQGSVRPAGVVEVFVLPQHGHQVALVPYQGPVEQFAAAAADPPLPAIWNDPATPARERKRIARLLLTDVTVTRNRDTITAHVRLPAGQHHTLTTPIPPTAAQIRKTPAAAVTAIDELPGTHTHIEIAGILNDRGPTSGEGRPFHRLMVRNIRDDYHLRSREQRLRDAGMLTLAQTAALLGVSTGTVKASHHAGLITGHPYNDKGQCLYPPPGPNPPTRTQGRKLSKRALPLAAPTADA